jgi:ATP-dependent helicase/DNAse subunit B
MRRRYANAVEQRGTQRVILLVPTERQRVHWRQTVLTESNLRGLWQPHVHTFDSLAQTLCEANGEWQTELPPTTQRALLRQIVERLARQNALSFFRSVHAFPGFLDVLQDFIHRAKRRGVTLDFAASHLPDAQRLELVRIGGEYQNLLHRFEVCDADDRLTRARALVRRGQRVPFEDVKVVLLDGFLNLSAVEWDIVERLSESAEEVWFTVTDEPDSTRAALFNPSLKMRNAVLERFPQTQLIPHLSSRISHPSALTHLAQALFREEIPDKPPADDTVQIIEAPGQFREMEDIAREVKRRLLDGEATPDDVALLFRNVTEDTHVVQEVFASFGIPVWLSVSPSPLHSPAVQTVLTMLQIVADDFRREDVVKFLKSNYVDISPLTKGAGTESPPLPTTHHSPNFIPDDLDFIARRARITAGRSSWQRRLHAHERQLQMRLERLEQGEPLEDFEESHERLTRELEQTRGAISSVENCFHHFSALSRARTRSQCVAAIRQLIGTFHVAERLPLDAQSAGAQVVNDAEIRPRIAAIASSEDMRAFEQLQRALEDLQYADAFLEEADKAITLTDFLSELQTALCLATPAADAADGCVAAMNAEEAAGVSFPYVFIGGLVEKKFPRPQNVHPLSPDESNTLEDFLFYTAVTRATQRLYLCYPTTDAEGRAVLTSFYVNEVRRCFSSELTVCSRARLSARGPELSRVCNSNELLDALTSRGSSSLIPHLSSLIPNDLLHHVLNTAAVETHRRSTEPFHHFDGVLSDDAILRDLTSRFSPQHRFSAQQFNVYGQCPIRFFFRYVLDLKPLEEPTDEMEALERGHIVHEILRRFFPNLHEETGSTAVTSQNLDAARQIMAAIIHRYFAEQIDQGRVGDERFWEIEKAHVLRDLTLLLAHEVKFAEAGHQPRFFEEAYGIGDRAPLVIGSDAEPVLVQGKIDRIDLLPGDENNASRFAVFDYKTGSRRRRWQDILDGTDFQLPLYALAAEQVVLRGMNAQCAAWSYYKVRRPIIPDDARVADDENMRQCLEATQRLLRQYASDVRRGQFPVAPRADICSFCEYRHVCRVGLKPPHA